MADPRSPLATVYAAGHIGVEKGPDSVTVHERLARDLVQVSGWPGRFAAVCRRLEARLECRLPEDGLRATASGDRAVFRVGPERLWLAGPVDDALRPDLEAALPGDDAVITDIGHSRAVLRIVGPATRVLLNRGLPIDLDEGAFPVNAFAQSVVHHIPLLVHRIELDRDVGFDLYVPRDFAVSFWEWLITAAEPLGGRVAAAR